MLSLLTTVGGAERATDSQLARACAACRTAVRLGDARGAATGHLETVVLHALGGDGDGDGDGDGVPGDIPGDVPGDDADVVDEEYGRRRGASLRSMAAFAAHALAERRGGWDHETAWARELEWGDGGDDDAGEDRVGAAIETPTVDGVRDVARGIAAVNVANETKEDEGEAEDEVAAAEWNMWESRSVLDYSVGFLRGALG